MRLSRAEQPSRCIATCLAIHPSQGATSLEPFLAAYETATGATLEHMPVWDLFYGLRGLRPIDHWVRALHGHGVMLTAEQISSRSIAWIEQALMADEDRSTPNPRASMARNARILACAERSPIETPAADAASVEK